MVGHYMNQMRKNNMIITGIVTFITLFGLIRLCIQALKNLKTGKVEDDTVGGVAFGSGLAMLMYLLIITAGVPAVAGDFYYTAYVAGFIIYPIGMYGLAKLSGNKRDQLIWACIFTAFIILIAAGMIIHI